MNRIIKGEKPENEKTGIHWTLDDNGTLTITGSGRIPDADCGRAPAPEWAAVKAQIREIRVEEGIESIGVNAFCGCLNLVRVSLSYTVSRIHAYAFRDCTALEEVKSERSAFRILGDPSIDDPEDTVVFGMESFRGTPWARCCFGDFYLQDGELYDTFVNDGEDVVIPDSVRVLRPYSLAHLKLNSLILPADLRGIRNFAFSGSRILSEMILPSSVTALEDYALADCGIRWKSSAILRETIDRVSPAERERFPSVIPCYTLSMKHRKAYGEYQRLAVVRKAIFRSSAAGEAGVGISGTESSSIISGIIDNSIDAGTSVLRRIRRGSVMICVKYTQDRLICVESFLWNEKNGLVNEYLMYPCRNTGKNTGESETDNPADTDVPAAGSVDYRDLDLWRDSFTWQEETDILDAFDSCADGAVLAECGGLREPETDVREEWFRSGDTGNFGGPLELDFLRMWLPLHPEVRVDSIAENIEHDRCRWFVPV